MPGSAIVDIRHSFGTTFIGLLVSTTLFGLTLSQTWMYFWHYHGRDPKALQFFIASITIVDTLITILSAYLNYWYLVLNFGNVEALDISIWALHLQIILGVILSSAVQLFYAKRVYIVSQSIICSIIIVACVVISLSFGIYYIIREITASLFSKFNTLIWISSTSLSAGALADVLIAAAMCWSLYRKRTGFARTDSMIMTLMTYSINSGLLTSILGVAATITFAISPPGSLSPLAIFYVLSKCYINSLLAMLNSRDYVRNGDRSTTDPENAFSLSSFRVDRGTPSGYGSKSRQPGVSVTVHNTTTSDFGRNSKSDHDVEPTFGIRKADASIIPLQNEPELTL